MRRLGWCAAALALACGQSAKIPSAPLDRIYRPTGLAVHAGRLVVASSNGDLLYDTDTGGSVIAFDPSSLGSVRVAGSVQVRSFAGDLAVADPAACGTLVDGDPSAALAVFATRGSNTLNLVRVAPPGAPGGPNELACERCGIALPGPQTDPLAVAVACSPGRRASAFVGYLRAPDAGAWVTEYVLAGPDRGTLRSVSAGAGPVRAFAYDAAHDRLYLAGVATGTPTPLRWIDLHGCTLGLPQGAGGCTVGQASLAALGTVELRSIALANQPFDGVRKRAYLSLRRYDPAAAATAGGRTTDLGGQLVAVDLVDNALGGVDVVPVHSVEIGKGAQDVRVLPVSPERAGLRDVVAAVSVDSGVVTLYDDDNHAFRQFTTSATTGAPELGHQPFGLAADPQLVGTLARVYVGSYAESTVTPLDVALDSLEATPRARITGGTP